MNFNRAIIAGNLTQDPEKRVTDSGTTIVSFSVATNRFYNDQSGQKQQEVEYHNVVFFGKTADNIARYMTKGSTVLVEGRIQTRQWEGSDGKTRYRTEIIGQTIQFGSRDLSSSNAAGSSKKSFSNLKEESKKERLEDEEIPVIEEDEDIDVEDIPF